MATTYTAISTTVVPSTAATIEFLAIPQTYDDLVIMYSARSNNGATNWNNFKFAFNGLTTNAQWRFLAQYNQGMATTSIGGQIEAWVSFNANTANTFSNTFVYISGYTRATSKIMNIETASGGNVVDQIIGWTSGLWENNAAITSITATPSAGSFMQYSTATLYGIKRT